MNNSINNPYILHEFTYLPISINYPIIPLLSFGSGMTLIAEAVQEPPVINFTPAVTPPAPQMPQTSQVPRGDEGWSLQPWKPWIFDVVKP